MSRMEEAIRSRWSTPARIVRFRNTCPAFADDSRITISAAGSTIQFVWENAGYEARLHADLRNYSYEITVKNPAGEVRKL